MASVPAKVAARITAGLKRFQPILASARTRDVNEADTVAAERAPDGGLVV